MYTNIEPLCCAPGTKKVDCRSTISQQTDRFVEKDPICGLEAGKRDGELDEGGQKVYIYSCTINKY